MHYHNESIVYYPEEALNCKA